MLLIICMEMIFFFLHFLARREVGILTNALVDLLRIRLIYYWSNCQYFSRSTTLQIDEENNNQNINNVLTLYKFSSLL